VADVRLRWEGIRLAHPAQLIVVAFASAIIVGTVLLSLPVSSSSGSSAGVVDALFTATSALCVTGLIVVDTGTAWTPFGQGVILLLIQLGGLGITTFGALFAVLVSRKLGLRSRMLAQTGANATGLAGTGGLVKRIALFALGFEAVGFVLLSSLFWVRHDASFGDAVYDGLFHSVSAYNNAGFSTFSDNVVGLRTDTGMLAVLGVLVVAGGLGYPVLNELLGGVHPRRWSIHTRMTVYTSVVLLAVGTVGFLIFEWSNPGTIADLDLVGKVQNALFDSAAARTAGFNTIDYAQAEEPTLLLTEVQMLIGGGSASAAGGIKVTTFALLGWVIWAELRGEPEVNAFGRRVPTDTQRQAVAVALLGVGAVVVGTILLGASTATLSFADTLFESVSALATCGLSTGITSDVGTPGRLVLVVLMFVGRLGPVTFGTALVLRARERRYRLPEGRPLIG
jgi:trk system potassium uptake protein